MGWATRARVSGGNPKPFTPRARFVSASKFQEGWSPTRLLLLAFSNRKYVMDAKGTLRRVKAGE